MDADIEASVGVGDYWIDVGGTGTVSYSIHYATPRTVTAGLVQDYNAISFDFPSPFEPVESIVSGPAKLEEDAQLTNWPRATAFMNPPTGVLLLPGTRSSISNYAQYASAVQSFILLYTRGGGFRMYPFLSTPKRSFTSEMTIIIPAEDDLDLNTVVSCVYLHPVSVTLDRVTVFTNNDSATGSVRDYRLVAAYP